LSTNVLLSLTSSNTTSFVVCSVLLFLVILLYIHIFTDSSLSFSYFIIVYVLLPYDIVISDRHIWISWIIGIMRIIQFNFSVQLQILFLQYDKSPHDVF
jgi:hypothetical protein